MCDNRLFKENFNKLKIFITLIPELVEKKEPPITTIIKKINIKLLGVSLNEIPIFDILLDMATKIVGKLLLEFKKTNEKEIIINKSKLKFHQDAEESPTKKQCWSRRSLTEAFGSAS